MSEVLINIDVPDLKQASDFYISALDLKLGRHLEDGFQELTGRSSNIYLLLNKSGSTPTPKSSDKRSFDRHWTPVHMDFITENIEASSKKVLTAGGTIESEIMAKPYGKLQLCADPFGNGFCLLQFTGRGYDELLK